MQQQLKLEKGIQQERCNLEIVKKKIEQERTDLEK